MNKDETKCYMSRIMREYGVSRSDIASKINSTRQYIGMLVSGERTLTNRMLSKLDKAYPIANDVNNSNVISIPFYANKKEFLFIDRRLIKSYDEKDLFIYEVSGNSMSPVYNDNSKVIVDVSKTSFIDGHVFLFKIGRNVFMRRINVSPDKIKCIPLNKEFDTFYLDNTLETIKVLGLIIPNIRL